MIQLDSIFIYFNNAISNGKFTKPEIQRKLSPDIYENSLKLS